MADDSADNRLLISAYLRREPCELDFAENGKIAFEKFKSNQYDMVFMDVQMPEIDGLAATELIRKWEISNSRAATPIVALTASALEEDVCRTLAAGCGEWRILASRSRRASWLRTINDLTLRRDRA